MSFNLSIVFDTNCVKNFDDSYLEFELNGLYEQLKQFVSGNNLDGIKLFIPKFVVDELIQQYNRDYHSLCKKIDQRIDQLYADAIKVNPSLELNNDDIYNTIENYEVYISTKADTYFSKESNNITILPYCTHKSFEKIVCKAFKKTPPFFGGKINRGNKEFSDAGFKDALIIESVLENVHLLDGDLLILSRDKEIGKIDWFDELPDREIQILEAETCRDVIDYLVDQYAIKDLSKYSLFANDEYFLETVTTVLKITPETFEVVDIYEEEDSGYTFVKVDINLNNSLYTIRLTDNNDFLEVMDNLTGEVLYEWES